MHFCCTQFDFSVFDNTTKPIPAKGKRSKKYPAVKPSYESASIPGLSFGKLNCLHTTDCGSSQRDYNPPLPYFLEGHAPPPELLPPYFTPILTVRNLQNSMILIIFPYILYYVNTLIQTR